MKMQDDFDWQVIDQKKFYSIMLDASTWKKPGLPETIVDRIESIFECLGIDPNRVRGVELYASISEAHRNNLDKMAHKKLKLILLLGRCDAFIECREIVETAKKEQIEIERNKQLMLARFIKRDETLIKGYSPEELEALAINAFVNLPEKLEEEILAETISAFASLSGQIISLLSMTLDVNMEKPREELFDFMLRKKNINNAQKFPFCLSETSKIAPELFKRTDINGYNPGINEIAKYLEELYSVKAMKEGSKEMPPSDTIKVWLRKYKPVEHNPKVGTKNNSKIPFLEKYPPK
jgi:hypothetical protein